MYLPTSILTLAAFALFGCDVSGISREKEVYPCQQDAKTYGFNQHRPENDLEIEIHGAGYLQVLDPDTGETLYTRLGLFGINDDGDLVYGDVTKGRFLEPAISIPEGATDITVHANGEITVKKPNTKERSSIGQIELSTFDNPGGLLKLEDDLYAETETSGASSCTTPGEDAGILVQID